jgi:hypothetical protein
MRLTIMSSFASVVDLSKNPRAGYTYTENDWDPVTMEKGQEDGFWVIVRARHLRSEQHGICGKRRARHGIL